MTDRHTADTITSDALDQLYVRAERAEAETRRLGLMVDEYGDGAGALTNKLKRIRDLHRETCILARGEVKSTAFKCGMCEVLDAPADRTALHERIAVLLAETDGWEYAEGLGLRDMSESMQQHYDKLATAVLAILPEPADRAAVSKPGGEA